MLESSIRDHTLQEGIIVEIRDRQNRENNIILFKVPDEDSLEADKEFITKLFPSTPFDISKMQVVRLGKFVANATIPRLLKVRFERACCMDIPKYKKIFT